jgi:hypothetical protein
MKKYSFVQCTLLILCAIVLFSNCSNKDKKKEESYTLQPKMLLSKKDTATVKNLTVKFLEYLKNNKIDQAVGMLSYYDSTGTVIPMPKELAAKQKMVFRTFPVLSYHIDGIIFDTETDCQVKYTIEFFKKKEGDNRPNTTSFFIKPIRRHDIWYLTMYDSMTSNLGESEIKN